MKSVLWHAQTFERHHVCESISVDQEECVLWPSTSTRVWTGWFGMKNRTGLPTVSIHASLVHLINLRTAVAEGVSVY